jgi:hypothetical protein
VIDLSQEECLYSLQYWLSIAKQLRVAHPNLSLPLAVIAAKSDLLNLSDGENLIKARSLQGRLRLLCLKGLPLHCLPLPRFTAPSRSRPGLLLCRGRLHRRTLLDHCQPEGSCCKHR